jgi:hypothetical protein
MNITGQLKYPAWVCQRHVRDKNACSMKFVREADLEDAFTTMMNKLIFARETVLKGLLDSLRGQTHKNNLHRVNEIDAGLDTMAERKQTLTTLMTKGYLDPATFTKETNALCTEAATLEEEKERLLREINGDMKKTESLRELLKYTSQAETLSVFDAELFIRFVDHITICSKEEAVFHLKCGLSLKERIG